MDEEPPHLKFPPYVLRRLARRRLTQDQVSELVATVQPFTFSQEGEVHLGYYDPGTRLFVAIVDDIVVTVFHTRPSYIEGLKRRLK